MYRLFSPMGYLIVLPYKLQTQSIIMRTAISNRKLYTVKSNLGIFSKKIQYNFYF